MTPQEELHQFIDQLDDDIIGPAFHAAVDTLPDQIVPAALKRLSYLRERVTDPNLTDVSGAEQPEY